MPDRGAAPNVHPVIRRVLDAAGALSSPLLPDDYLEMINPLWSTRELRVLGQLQPGSSDLSSSSISPSVRAVEASRKLLVAAGAALAGAGVEIANGR